MFSFLVLKINGLFAIMRVVYQHGDNYLSVTIREIEFSSFGYEIWMNILKLGYF